MTPRHPRTIRLLCRRIRIFVAPLLLVATSITGAAEPGRGAIEDAIFASSFEAIAPGAPIAGSEMPPRGSVLAADAAPTIGARVEPGSLQGATLHVDGNAVAATIEADRIVWTPSEPLPEGLHEVRVEVPGAGVLAWSFVTRTAPDLVDQFPARAVIDPAETIVVGASYVDIGAGIDPATVRLSLDGVDVTAQAVTDAESVRYTPPAALTAGSHVVRLGVTDRAGNRTEREWNFIVSTRPEISNLSPLDVTLAPDGVEISASYLDAASAIDPASLRLLLDDVDVTAQAEVTSTGERSGTIRLRLSAPLEAGRHRVSLEVGNARSVVGQAFWGFWVEHPPIHRVEFITPAEGAVLPEARVEVRVFPESNRSLPSRVFINAIEARTRPDEEGRIYRYAEVDLVPGSNTLTVQAEFEDGEVRTATRTVSYDAPPVVTIESPLDWDIIGPVQPRPEQPVPGGAIDLTGTVQRPIVVRGRTDRPVAAVQVNQQAAQLSPDGLRFEFPNFFLREGTNLISVNAVDVRGRASTANVTVYVDQTAPLLTVEGPAEASVTSRARIDVRGIVNDAVEGGLAPLEPVVEVTNLANGQQVPAQVGDRYFFAADVPLEVGRNRIEVVARDALGNARVRTLEVDRVFAGSRRITEAGGNRQQAPVEAPLPEPLSVVVLDERGSPIAGLPVRFDVVRGSGHLALVSGEPGSTDGVNPARNLQVETDANGEARVRLTLGNEASVAGNVVRAWHEDIAEDTLFTATGTKGEPAWVMINGASGSQFAQVNSTPVEALSVVVMDAAHNRLEGVPVTFELDADAVARFTPASARGGRLSANLREIVVLSDRNGIAAVRPLVGDAAGNVTLRARVERADGSSVGEAGFQIIALERADGPTAFVGKVLDHAGMPLSGVRLSIARTNLSATSDAAGDFEFPAQVPSGKIDLFIDGREVRRERGGVMVEYPALHFETAVIQGARNQLAHPIYLPPVVPSDARIVGGDEDVVLTIPGFEGFEMKVHANSVTFPDGSRTGPLVVSPVHNDRLPMVPPGAAGMFAGVGWTIQPTGTRFDPPIEVRIPNVTGERPGETMPIVQWDHDLATFVPMGRGTVNEDGTLIVSDPGTGISKAGWGGGGPPPPPPNCGANDREPRLHSVNIRFYNVKRRFWGLLWEYDDETVPQRLSKFYPSKFTIAANPFGCNDVSYEWNFGDDSPDAFGVGEEVRHDYEDRGEYFLEASITCNYSKCPSTSGQQVWDPSNFSDLGRQIRVRDTDWVEFQAMQTECGWNAGCWLEHQSQELMLDVEETLQEIEIEWLEDVQQWNSDKLNDMGQAGGLSDGEITTLAILYAANETIFPSTALDVVPVGRGVAALKKAKRLGGSADELAELAPQISRRGDICPLREPVLEEEKDSAEEQVVAKNCINIDVPEDMIRWQRAERALINDVSALRGGSGGQTLRVYQPTRGRNNGFDGAVVWRDATGKLQLDILESKAWGLTSRELKPNDLSAFGMRADPTTLQKNKDVLIQHLRNNPPGGISPDSPEFLELIDDLQQNRFRVIIGGIADTRLNEAAVRAGVTAHMPNVKGVEFRRVGV